MSEPLHLQPDPEPQLEQVRLGDETYNLDPATARGIRNAFEALAGQYATSLEEYRRQALQSIGTPQGQQMAQQEPPPGLEIPDPDVLFQNKQAWTQGLGNSLEQRLAIERQQNLQMTQGVLGAVQNELNRRDAAQQAKQLHDRAMEEMLDRRGLTDNRLVVQAVYNQNFEKLKHLPLELALDKIGAEAQEEIGRIRSGENWQLGPANTQTGVAPRPPKMLRSVQRAAAPRPAPAPADRDLEPAGGGLGMMGKIIRKRQAGVLGVETV